MKELSIEEKAKRYDEAIEKLRSLHDNYDTVSTLIDIKEELEHIFPELKENKDELMRRKLLALIEWAKSYAASGISPNEAKEMTTWLEKQGKKGTNGNEREIPNPAWSEDDELYLEDAIHAAKELYDANCGGDELVDWLKSLKDRVQPQPQKEWSEEDERMRKASIRACQYMVENFENSTWDYEDAIDWLKSLKNKVQPKQEWSEDDENRFNNLVWLVEHSNEGKATKEGFIKFINSLKTLKDRVQSQWKPSEEQMAHLVAAIEESDGNCILQSLYNDLKKL